MTVEELIGELSQCPNGQAEVKARHGWERASGRHYTLAVDQGDEPVLVISWRPDSELVDDPGGELDP